MNRQFADSYFDLTGSHQYDAGGFELRTSSWLRTDVSAFYHSATGSISLIIRNIITFVRERLLGGGAVYIRSRKFIPCPQKL